MSKGSNESLTKSRSLQVFEEDVSQRDVAQAYLQAEFPNILGEGLSSDKGSIGELLETLSDEQINRLLEAVSYSYRMNGVFHTVTDRANKWLDVELPIDAITLTGTKPHINDIVYSPEIANRPAAFAEYLANYFDEFPETEEDPQSLNEFRPRSTIEVLRNTRLLTAERKDKIEIVDGTHRLLTSAILGAVSVRAFAAVPNGKESISMKGDSTFLTLRLQYEEASTEEEREHVLQTCALLANSCTDGAQAIQVYWIDHPRNKKIKAAGETLLTLIKRP